MTIYEKNVSNFAGYFVHTRVTSRFGWRMSYVHHKFSKNLLLSFIALYMGKMLCRTVRGMLRFSHVEVIDEDGCGSSWFAANGTR
jgi:hypothetical protein